MSLENHQAHRHGAIHLRSSLGIARLVFFYNGMLATHQPFDVHHIAELLAHLASVLGNHVVVHPIVYGRFAVEGFGLGDFAFVVRKHQIHTAPVNIEGFAEVFGTHHGTFQMPSRKALTPRRVPAHEVFGRCLFPEGKIGRMLFFVLAFQSTIFAIACTCDEVFADAPRKLSIRRIHLLEALHIQVDRAIGFVGQALFEDFLGRFYLLQDMACGRRLYGGRQHIELLHQLAVFERIGLYYLHRLFLFQLGFFRNFVFALIGIVHQMAYIGDIAHIAYLVAEVLEVAEEYIEYNGRTGIADMWVAIHGRAAYIHAYTRRSNGLEKFFFAT